MSRGWCRVSATCVLGVGRMGPVVTRINIYLLWGRGGGAWSSRAEQSYREQAWLLVGSEVWFPQSSRQEGRGCRRETKAIKCAALPRTGSPCLSRNTTRLWPRRPPPGSHRFSSRELLQPWWRLWQLLALDSRQAERGERRWSPRTRKPGPQCLAPMQATCDPQF